ncbi:GGDEF domain-containing protein [Chitinimonas koreensis]|uniref:GGDEF domain-containing protein n=1 Tax=Chitinimonas koreensis TaxID=356302 RepID=UPI00041403F0|nr:diguanylate cyclase [Chitinimonas koreensis]
MTETPQQTVLIVDDDRISRTMLAELLKDECRVVLAKDGASALQRIEEDPDICLVLLDVSMPEMSGYEVLIKLRGNPLTADLAVVFISGFTEEENEEQGLQLGALDYVFKPIRPVTVRARIRNYLKLVAQRRELQRLASHDGLTGLVNRRYFDEALALACRQAARRGEPLNLAMIDVDYFKQYNDRYGHPAGDEALRQVARLVQRHARRPDDVAARYGGEEFVLLLPGQPDFGALLEALRGEVQALGLEHLSSKVAPCVTISVGAVTATVDEAEEAAAALLHRADANLYAAKQAGRNRVVRDGAAEPAA